MALTRIDPSKPICLNAHKTLINRLRTNVRLERLVKKHEKYLLTLEVKDLPTLWGRAGVPFRSQIDLALGLASMKPRNRDGLVSLFDKEADKRWQLDRDLKNGYKSLGSLKRQPFNTIEEQESLFAQISEVKSSITAIEGRLSQLDLPIENGAISECFKQTSTEQLVKEGFIDFTATHSYQYHLTPKTISMIRLILEERDRIQSLVDRHEDLHEDEVGMVWFSVKKKLPIKPKKIQ